MPSQTLLSLLTLVLSAATCQAGLRGTPTTITDSSSSLTLRITRSVDLLRQENGEFTHDHHQLLSIPIENGQETGAFHSIELPQDIVTEYEDRIATGELFVSIPSEHATPPGDHIILSDPTVVSVLDHVPISTRRRRLGRVDTRKVAVLRVSMGGGPADKRQVAYSATQIRQQIFERSMSLKGQVENCSNGSMQINEGGVYEVTVPGAFTDFPAPAHLRNRALELFAQQLGVSSANNQFDHVIVILPPNDFAGFVGNAGVNHWVSTLNNEWSLDVMVYMHEFGHNLGLNHASLTDNSGDYSSYMSATGWKPNLEGPLKCYNGASNDQLGWFDDRKETINLFSDQMRKLKLASFTEGNKGNKNDPLLIKVGKYLIQYNLASSFNSGTELLRDKVTVSYAESGKTIVDKEGLDANGRTFTLNNFEGSGHTLRIQACDRVNGDGYNPTGMTVGITLGRDGSPCSIPLDNTPPPQTPAPPPKTDPATPPPPPKTDPTTPPPPPKTQPAQPPPPPKTKPAPSPPKTKPAPPPPPPPTDSNPIDNRPTCPNTAWNTVTLTKGRGRKKRQFQLKCVWIGKNAKRARRFCRKNNIGSIFQKVYQVCEQECAEITDACVPAQ